MAEAGGSTFSAGNRPVRALRAFAVVVLGGLAGVVFHPVVGFPIAAAGSAALVYRRMTPAAVAAAAIAGLLAGGLSSATLYTVVVPLVGVELVDWAALVQTALAVASFVLVGPVGARMVRSLSPFAVTAALAVGLSVLQLGALWVLANGAGQGLQQFLEEAISGMIAATGSAGLVDEAAVSLWPSMMVALNGFASLASVVAIGAMARRAGVAVRQYPALHAIDLDPRAALLPIGAIVLLAVSRLQVGWASTAEAAGVNLLIVARWVFFLQGVAVFAGLYQRAGVSRPVRLLGFALLGVTEALLPLVSLTGLADVWLNIRRLPRDGAGPGAVEAPRSRD
jgi:hypothetical protein